MSDIEGERGGGGGEGEGDDEGDTERDRETGEGSDDKTGELRRKTKEPHVVGVGNTLLTF